MEGLGLGVDTHNVAEYVAGVVVSHTARESRREEQVEGKHGHESMEHDQCAEEAGCYASICEEGSGPTEQYIIIH